MKKKIVSVMLSAAMAATVLAGCGSSNVQQLILQPRRPLRMQRLMSYCRRCRSAEDTEAGRRCSRSNDCRAGCSDHGY